MAPVSLSLASLTWNSMLACVVSVLVIALWSHGLTWVERRWFPAEES